MDNMSVSSNQSPLLLFDEEPITYNKKSSCIEARGNTYIVKEPNKLETFIIKMINAIENFFSRIFCCCGSGDIEQDQTNFSRNSAISMRSSMLSKLKQMTIDEIKSKGESIGRGCFGEAYKFDNYVCKIQHEQKVLQSNLKTLFIDSTYDEIAKAASAFSPERSAQILNDVNEGKDAWVEPATSFISSDGVGVLFTPFIGGRNLEPLEYNAIFGLDEHKTPNGRILYDARIDGNIKIIGKETIVIDVDLAATDPRLKHKNSDASTIINKNYSSLLD